LRPKRSDIGPAVSAPNARPSRPPLITGPSASRGIAHALEIDGAIKPIITVSSPSSITISMHNSRTSHWKRPTGCASRKYWTSSGSIRSVSRY